MSMESKKSMGWAILLIFLGVAALYGGTRWLSLVVPAAALIWFSTKPRHRGGRN